MYQWLADSNAGTLVIRGQQATIVYYQGGRCGQGRIKIEAREVGRLRELMRVRPQRTPRRPTPTKQRHFPGIHVELGVPGDQ